MRIRSIAAAVMSLSLVFSAGCGKKESSSSDTSMSTSQKPFTPQYKTVSDTINVLAGMIPQVIVKDSSYVKNSEDGEWAIEKSEIKVWKWADDFDICGTAWSVETNDAFSLLSPINEYYKDKPASLFFVFGENISDFSKSIGKTSDGTDKLDVKLTLSLEAIFICEGEKLYVDDVSILGMELFEDGSVNLAVDFEGETLTICLPNEVKKSTKEEFQAAMPTQEEILRSQSETYIAKTCFDDLTRFAVTSDNLKDGLWDVKITDTKYGENLSPQLSWDKVDGASEYVVIMIDNTWLHMDVYTRETSLSEGAIGKGDPGDQYVGPYPPSGTHTYSVFVFALKNEMGEADMHFNVGGNYIDTIYRSLDKDKDGNTGNVIAYGRLDGNYTHQD